ncbi:MAG: AAA family ATPase [Muribaculaceae bacterium]|nr:AAA family ATPase [Muribaculaceae bacterium]
MPEHIDLNNPEFQSVWNLILHTRQSVFLTGKAGTGKSTFLKYICANTRKKHVVLAPTGIAAVNVGGQTLHSFFKIPFKPLLPDDPDFAPIQIRKTLRYPKDKVRLLQALELIIIDEISMVRADIIDFIDRVLKIYCNNMREPFGGKQLLFVGDIFQLEPVVTRDMRDILRRFYHQFFFFNARVFNQLGLVPIELLKIYRQTDAQFISLLDRVRIDKVSRIDLMTINSRCNPAFNDQGQFVITIATRRDTVNAINDEHMAALKTPERTYMGTVEGSFPTADLPTAQELTLKVGAQVIFIRNDKDARWVNGTIGKVSRLDDDILWVEREDGIQIQVEVETWENIQYSYDEKQKKVIEHVLGSFSQYPVKPAWALTVHKSQGLTFNNVVIDFAGGAFSSGQTYVALSRCTSLEGITLLKPLGECDFIVNPAIITFSQQFNNQAAIDLALNQEKAWQLYRRAIHAYDHGEMRQAVEAFAQAARVRDVLQLPAVQRLIASKLVRVKSLMQEVATLKQELDNHREMLRQLALEYCEMGNQSLGTGSLACDVATPYGDQPALDDIAISSAIANFNKALRICPDCVEALIGKGKLLHTIGEHDHAVEQLKNAVKLDGANFLAHLTLAQVYDDLKQSQNAIKSYKRAARTDKKSPLPHEALERIYERLGLDDLADEHQQIARRLRAGKKKSKR